MPLVSELELPLLDSTEPGLRGERFHAEMDALASSGWLAASPLGYYVLDRESASFFLRTRSAVFPGMKLAELFGIDSGPLREEMERNILHLSGDAHRRLRNLVNPAFTPRAADRWRPAMRAFAAELIGSFASAGRCEFVGAFAKPYPSMTIAAVMGAPVEDAPLLHAWSNTIQRQFDPVSLMNVRAEIERAVAELYEYVGALIEERRAAPADDLISALVTADVGGDRLTDVECRNLVLNVLVGGVDTTQSQLSHAVRLLATHPAQWERLAADVALVPAAVEEVLRFEPITPFTARITLEEIEHRGVTFPPDTIVLVAAFAANRDHPEVEAPGEFDLAAPRGGAKPLTFGAGIHYCLGANLARAEMQEALALLAPALPGLALDGEPRLGSVSGVYGVEEMPIRFAASA